MNKFRMTMNLSIFALTMLSPIAQAMEETLQETLGQELLKAAAEGNKATMEQLIAAGASPNYGPCSITPLRKAAENGHTECVRLLIAAGADVNQGPEWCPVAWFPALTVAAQNNHKESVRLLLAAGAHVNQGRYGRNHDNTAYDNGHTALICAAENGHLDCIQLLIQARADVNKIYTSYGGWTALQEATCNGHYNCCELLIAAGADINQAATRGTALMWAAKKGHQNCVQLLLDAGTDVTIKSDDFGHTALTCAAEGGHAAICNTLVEWMLSSPQKMICTFLMCLKRNFDRGTYNNLRHVFKSTLHILLRDLMDQNATHILAQINSLEWINSQRKHLGWPEISGENLDQIKHDLLQKNFTPYKKIIRLRQEKQEPIHELEEVDL